MLSKRISKLTPSATVSLAAKVKTLKEQEIQIIDLGLGESDFATPEHVKKAAKKALDENKTHYTHNEGIAELRQAVAQKLLTENNIKVSKEQVLISSGSKLSLYLAFMALCNPLDEVLIATPTWNTYIEQVKLTGAKPVFIKLKPPFILTAESIKKNITKKTKILLLNSPANPTGAVIPKQELEKISELVIKKNIWVISDEIYEKLSYKTSHFSIASFNKKIQGKTITINGFSKAFAMTGWRLGYACGPKEVIQAMTDLQGQIAFNAPSIAQHAGFTALTTPQQEVESMRKEFEKRRDFLVASLKNFPRISFIIPQGAFYLFINIQKLLGLKFKTATEWCKKLLEKEHVSLVPGEAFLYPGYVRLSYAASMQELEEGIRRIKKFILES